MTDLIEQTIQAARTLAGLGLSPGSSGNISCLIDGSVWLSASGTQFQTLKPDQLAQIRLSDGSAEAAGNPVKPSKEAPLHLALYHRNPELRCIIHLHSPAASAVACLPAWSEYSAIPPISPYAVMRVGNLPLIGYEHPGSPVLGDLVASHPVPFDCALLQNHGSLAGGTTVDQALDRVIEIETACNLVLRLAPFDTVNMLTTKQADELARANRRPWAATDYRTRD